MKPLTPGELRAGESSVGEPAGDPLALPPFTKARRVRAELVASILRSGRVVPDEAFDELYPSVVRCVSSSHWTPVRVGARAVELLRLEPGQRLIDVGAGVGKFCIVAAAMSQAHVRGVERRPELATIAREVAHRLGTKIEIVDGSFDTEEPHEVDAAYFFNPFAEAILLPGVQYFAADRFEGQMAADVVAAETFLSRARVGMRLITYCGFGGTVPDQYDLLAQEVWDGGILELWEKRRGP